MKNKPLYRRKSKEKNLGGSPFFTGKKEKDTKIPFFSDLKPKLSLSKSGDASEKQADRLADRYNSKAQKQEETSFIDRAVEEEMPPEMMRQKEEEEKVQLQQGEEELQMQENEEEWQTKVQQQKEPNLLMAKPEKEASASFEAQLEALKKKGGFPLPENLRKEYEGFFKKDLKKVRLHAGEDAAKLCRILNAQAFTHRNHIFFNEGKYAPDTSAGKHLLAHELTHAIQQKKDG